VVTLQLGENITCTIANDDVPAGAAILGDRVWLDQNLNGIQDDGEPGVPDVPVILYRGDGTPTGRTTTTDTDGFYRFEGLEPGEYLVEFVPPIGRAFTTPNVGSDDEVDSDADRLTGRTGIITLSSGEVDLTWDAGLIPAPALELICEQETSTGTQPVLPGSTISYTLTFSNTGEAPASGVVITETVPNFTEFVASQSTPTWACPNGTQGGAQCVFDVGTVGANSSNTLRFVVRVFSPLTVPGGGINIVNEIAISDDGSFGRRIVDTATCTTLIAQPTSLDPGEQPGGPTGTQIFVPTIRK
jgi:uncharacterized repeat protein (TIGR01451 family)